mmetsp:Transcript_115213/g.229509  ORF Transcript_115213/g.229509 Transcript_115213/m.229509 type:complete len:134 (+) Transcript_115213:59-460(+)
MRQNFLEEIKLTAERRKPRRVLTIRCVAQGPGELQVSACNLAGEELAAVTVDLDRSCRSLHQELAVALGHEELRADGTEIMLSFTLPDGRLLAESSGSVAAFFGMGVEARAGLEHTDSTTTPGRDVNTAGSAD